MVPKFHHLSCSYTLLLITIFSLSCSTIICQSHLPNTPLDYLKALSGTHKGDKSKGLNKLKEYLKNLGYINSKIPTNKYDDFFDDTLELAIKKYQEFYNIKITGFLDPETVTLMLKPRCGVADLLTTNRTPFRSYYNLSGYSWPPNKRNLTYSLPKDTRKDAYAPIVKSLIKWVSVSPFNFTFTDDFENSDVKISFETRDHGDGYPFDGPYGVLGHSFYPTDGRLHFDAEENWKPFAEAGSFYLGTVALHELGHILGLAHSQDEKSIMYAYIGEGENKDLTQDDIHGIKSIYPS
ncbi:hypothetical protein ABFS82_04G062600 [Erythranthe guttata]